MLSTIIRDRLTQRARVLRVRWHTDGDALLRNGKYLDFTDGLLRLMRQLDAISSAITNLPQSESGSTDRQGAAMNVATRGRGTGRPARGPTNNLA